MNCRKIQRLLSPYLDGELRSHQAAMVQTHLRGCAQCQKALEDLRQLVHQARSLAPAILTTDLWPAIERRILAQQPVVPAKTPRRAPLSAWRPRIAWAMGLAAVFLSLFFLRQHFSSPTSTPQTAQSQAQLLAAAQSDIDLARTYYQNSISALENIVAHRAHQMDPDQAGLFRQKLVHLEETIDECSIALEKNSYDIRAQRALFDAYDSKISTLREMAVSAQY